MTSAIERLSNDISTKVFIVNKEGGLSGYYDLSVVKISANEYENMVVLSSCDDKTIYIVQSDETDVHGDRIVNVADAQDLSDAVNLGLLNRCSDQLSSGLMGYVDEVGRGKPLSGYYNDHNLSSCNWLGLELN